MTLFVSSLQDYCFGNQSLADIPLAALRATPFMRHFL
jgi:hypothetical protein